MLNDINMRAIMVGKCIKDKNLTIREVAKLLNISKSTVHNDIHKRLKYLDNILYDEVIAILCHNLMIRHIRGGESTKQKYLLRHKVSQNK